MSMVNGEIREPVSGNSLNHNYKEFEKDPEEYEKSNYNINLLSKNEKKKKFCQNSKKKKQDQTIIIV